MLPLSWICVIVVLAAMSVVSARFVYLLARNMSAMLEQISSQHEDLQRVNRRVDVMVDNVEQAEMRVRQMEQRVYRPPSNPDFLHGRTQSSPDLSPPADAVLRELFEGRSVNRKEPAQTSFERILKDDPEDPV